MQHIVSIGGGDTATPLNLAKRVRLVREAWASSADALEEPPRFLDCGCGAGAYVAALAAAGWHASGVEFVDDKIEQARAAGLSAFKVVQADLERLPFEDGSFDVLLYNEVLEHVPNDRTALLEAYRVLRTNGHLIIFSPNRLYPFESHGVYLKGSRRRIPVWVPFIPYVPYAVGRHLFDYWARNYWPHELRRKVADAGFSIRHASFVWQTFEGISGDKARLLSALRPQLRALSSVLEKTPVLRSFGVSQFIHGIKAPAPPSGKAEKCRHLPAV